jgi:ubiquinone/menaquinone biosynthesis C-methylase UbiE
MRRNCGQCNIAKSMNLIRFAAALWMTVFCLAGQPMPANVSVADLKADEQKRDKWEKLAEVIQALDLKPGSRVADIGSGYGYFAVRFAPAVGPGGQVFAEEIDRPLIARLQRRIADEKLTNLTVVLGTPDNPKLPANSLDAILMSDVYHEVSHPLILLGNLRKALKPGGWLMITDYLKPELRKEPRQRQAKDHNIAPELVEQDLRDSGFTLIERREPFTNGYDGIPVYFVLAR